MAEHDKVGRGDAASTAFIYAAVALAVAAALFLFWKASIAFLLIFGGILLATAFDSLARLIRHVLPVARRWRVALAILLVGALLGVALFYGARALVAQFAELTGVIEDQMGMIRQQLVDAGLLASESENGLSGLLPDGTTIFGGTTQAILTFFGGVGNFVLLIFLGIFFAAEPSLYKRGVVSLFPPRHRERASEVLDAAGCTLHNWLIGQSISMAMVFAVSLVVLFLIDMPFAALLALQAGLFAFIPLLGPVLAGVPIVLAGLSESPTMAVWGFGAYVLIQMLESYTIQPVVQERTVSLPPALTLSLQLVTGVLFGLMGVALAVPLGATVMTIVGLTYVEGMLGGPWKGDRPRDA